MNFLEAAIAAVGFVGTVAGGAYYLDDRHAHHNDVVQLTGYINKNFENTTEAIKQLKNDTARQFRQIEAGRLRNQLFIIKKETKCEGPLLAICRDLEKRIENTERR